MDKFKDTSVKAATVFGEPCCNGTEFKLEVMGQGSVGGWGALTSAQGVNVG